MSASNHRCKISRNWRVRRRFYRTAENRAERHAERTEQRSEARESWVGDEALEVLADFHEQAGRARLAELLRRGR